MWLIKSKRKIIFKNFKEWLSFYRKEVNIYFKTKIGVSIISLNIGKWIIILKLNQCEYHLV